MTQDYSGLHADPSRDTFAQKALIYIATTPPKWVDLATCRWDSPKCLRRHVSLSKRYSKLEEFFVIKLGIKSATAFDLVTELEYLGGKPEQFLVIKSLLWELNSYAGTKKDDVRKVQTLKDGTRKIVPVKGYGENLRSCGDLGWFIADKPKLEQCFKGHVALLDFTSKQIEELAPLLKRLGVQDRKLSLHYKERTESAGESTLHESFTYQLRSKAELVAR